MNDSYSQFYYEMALFNQIDQLRDYYSDKGLTIIGLNDSQGVNTTTLFRKGLLEYLAHMLKSEELNPKVINAFSLMFNKTEHIDYFLESNLSVADIKDLQVTGMVSALEKAMKDFKLPCFLGKIGYVSKALYHKNPGDDKLLLTTVIKESTEPTIIYSCGANDLMREGWNNPFAISRDYKNRNKNDNYKYTLEKYSDPFVTKRIINRVEGNINHILNINPNSDIYTLGLYIPKSMQSDGMEIFNDAIMRYNQGLMKLCDEYKLCYIDTEEVSERYNNSDTNFHISTKGHNELANQILREMHQRKLWHEIKSSQNDTKDLKIYNHGLYDILINLKHDLDSLKAEQVGSIGREAEVFKAKIAELERQEKTLEKVLMKRY